MNRREHVAAMQRLGSIMLSLLPKDEHGNVTETTEQQFTDFTTLAFSQLTPREQRLVKQPLMAPSIKTRRR